MTPNILYVEDEDAARELVSDQLKENGYRVSTASSGEMATEILQKESFDLVLLDIRMPGKNGLDVLKFIRERGIPSRVIMVTAVEELSIAIESVRLGANDYLTKPYTLEILLSSIKRTLAR